MGACGDQHSVNVVEGRQSLFLHPALNQALGFTLEVELQTKVLTKVRDLGNALTRALFCLKAPTCAFKFKTLLRHYMDPSVSRHDIGTLTQLS